MAKQVLITCDSCAKATPVESIRKWWGLQNTGGDIPDMKFAPLRQDNLDHFKSHACSEVCLVRILKVFAESVDMKKAATAVKAPSGMPSFFSLMRGLGGDMGDTTDSIGYYKKPDPEEEEDGE